MTATDPDIPRPPRQLLAPGSGPHSADQLRPGMTARREKRVTDRDIALFAEASTDHNPVHLDDAWAEASMFKGRIAHGMLSASLISAVIGEELPGHGAIYLRQNLSFLAPVRPGDLLCAEVTVIAVDVAKRRVTLETTASVGKTMVLKGEALVMAPARASA